VEEAKKQVATKLEESSGPSRLYACVVEKRRYHFLKYWTAEITFFTPGTECGWNGFSIPFSAKYDAEAVVIWASQKWPAYSLTKNEQRHAAAEQKVP
jgi:hypothetical protein